jgi:hypothetical protein
MELMMAPLYDDNYADLVQQFVDRGKRKWYKDTYKKSSNKSVKSDCGCEKCLDEKDSRINNGKIVNDK